jgi:predicted RNA-binding Zn-ribbon protein involved in translation (DUF1610 family)
MSSLEPDNAKPARSFDGAYGFSFTIAIALILFIAGLVISLTFGQGATIGLVFGIPMIIAGLLVPLLRMRGQFTQTEVSGPCPYCGAGIKTSDTAIRLECPACNRVVAVRDLKLYAVES